MTNHFLNLNSCHIGQKNNNSPAFTSMLSLFLRIHYMRAVSAGGVGSPWQRAVSEKDCPAARLGRPPLHRPALLSGHLCSHDLHLRNNPPAQPGHACGQVCRRPHLPPDAGSPDCCCNELFVPFWPAVSSGLYPQATSIHLQLHCVPGLHHCPLPPGHLHF